MENGFYADVTSLLQHSIDMKGQIRTVQLLREQLYLARQLMLPAETACLDGMIAETEKIIYFLSLMSETIENAGWELEQLSLRVGKTLENCP